MKNLIVLIGCVLLAVSCGKSDDGPFIKPNPSGGTGTIQGPDPDPDPNPGGGTTSSASLSDITSGFEQIMNIYGFQGAQVAIVRENRLVYLESFGKADVDANTDVHINSLFRIASISKPITLTAISKLVAEGQLGLDDLVFGEGSILGTEYGNLPYEPDEELITVSHLIEHKGGFSNDPFDIMFDDIGLTHDGLIAKVLDERSLTHKPGTQYEYSNFGYSLLGRIIEKVTGMTYKTYVQNAIFTPMEITDMKIGGNTQAEAHTNEVTYYANYASPYEMNVTRMDAHGGWIASAKDLARFAMKSDTEGSVPDLLGPGERLSYLEGGNWNHNGALPGTLSVLQISYPTSYVVLVNKGVVDFPEVIQALRNFMREKTRDRTNWPNIDVLDDL